MTANGGSEWEQGQAVTRMVTAIRQGDQDAMASAMGDYAAALGSRTTNILSSIVAAVMVELHEARAERKDTARIMDHKLDLIIAANDATQQRLDRLEAAGADRQEQIDALIVRLTRLEHEHDP